MATMNEKTMTERAFLESITESFGKTLSAEQADYVEGRMEKLKDQERKRNEKREEKLAAEKPLYDALVAALTSQPQTASDLKDVIEQNVQKTSAMLRVLVDSKRASVTDLKVKGRTTKGYFQYDETQSDAE